MRKGTIGVLVSMLLCTVFAQTAAADAPLGELSAVLTGTNPPGSCWEETSLGDVAADGARAVLGADAALIHGGAIGANLQGGEVTLEDIQAVFPQNEPLVLVSVSREELGQMLEEGIAFLSMTGEEQVDYTAPNPGGFPQISGIRFAYDPTAPAGRRVTELETEAAGETLLLVCPRSVAEGNYGYSALDGYELTDETLVSAMAGYFEGKTVSVPKLGRIVRVGTAEDSIIGKMPAGMFWLVIAVLILCSLQRVGKRKWLDV